jgi:hypothetical protein
MKVPPAAVINIIRENLNDRYRKGFPIIKELVQNADDAGAAQLHLGWVESLSGVEHPLLQGPALFIVNDGTFKAADGEAIDCIGLSSKASSKFSVGKFGLGLKSIFHLCEAFFYVAIDDQTGQTVAHIVNPWADSQGQDEFHLNWAGFSPTDQQVITTCLSPILNQDRFFCLWIPLRRQDQLQGRAPITKDFPGDTSHPPQFLTDHSDTQLATLLPMLRSLQIVAVWLPDGNKELQKIFQIQLGDGANRRRYPFEGSLNQALALNGSIKIERFNSPVVAIERHKFGGFELLRSAPELERLRHSDLWPSSGSTDVETGAYIINQDKADPHCAVCFSEYPTNGEKVQLAPSLAVFLSVDEPAFKPVVLEAGSSNFALTLHGYFFLDAGRSRIEGLETRLDTEMPVDEQSLRFEWNARLFQQGTLPLLLPALQQFINDIGLSVEKVQALTRALQKSELFINITYRAGVCRDYQWVYCISPDGNQWRLLDATAPVFEIPAPPVKDPKRPFIVLPALSRIKHLTVREVPRLTPQTQTANWDDHLAGLLEIPVEVVFGSQGNLDYLLEFLENYASLGLNQSHITDQLLQLARQAFRIVDLSQLGSYRSRVQRFINLIPPEQRFTLQLGESLEKSAFFAPAMAVLLDEDLDVLVVPGGFDAPSAPAANQINGNDAVKLLSRLVKFDPERIQEDRFEEVQTAIALKIIAAVQPTNKEQVLNRCGNLTLFRGYDFEAGREVSLRLRELNDLLQKKTLFRFANPLANPNTEGETARLQKSLRNSRVVLVRADIATLISEDVPTCTARACIQTLALHPDLSAADNRVELLTSLSGQLDLQNSLNRRCLRYLLHGQKQDYEADDTPLLVGDVIDTQNVWARITDCILALEGADWQVIDRSLANHLNPNQRQELGIKPINRSGVEALLQTEKHFAEVNRRLQFTSEECDLLLQELPIGEPLQRLKIHETIDGHRVAIDKVSYLADAFELSPVLKKHITLLRRHSNSDLADKQNRLAPTLTPTAAITVVINQSLPGAYWEDVMNALAETMQPAELPLDNLKQNKWLPLAEKYTQSPPSSQQSTKSIISKAADFFFSTKLHQSPTQPHKPDFIAPQDVIYLGGLNEEVARLVAIDQAFYDIEQLHNNLRQHPAFDKLIEFRVLPTQNEALDMLGEIMQDHEQYWLGLITALDTVESLDRFRHVFQAAPPELMPAYPIINAVCSTISTEVCLEYLLPHLKQSIDAERMVTLLEFLANQHTSAGIRDKKGFFEVHSWYLAAAAKMQGFASIILPNIKVLNQLDEWKSPAKLCYNVAGIDKGDLLSDEQGRIIPTNRPIASATTTEAQTAVSWPVGNRNQQLMASVEQLKVYFKAWEGALERREIVGGLLCLLGDYPGMTEIVDEYLLKWDIETVRDMVKWKPIDAVVGGAKVPGYGMDIHEVMHEQRFLVAVTAADAKTQTVISLTGQFFEARLTQESSLDNLIAGDEHRKNPSFIENDLQINYLCLRQINPARHSTEKLSALLRATSAWILQNIYFQKVPNLNRVWEELEQSEQLDIQLTQALLLESAFFYLRQLGVQSDQEIGPVLRAWEDARRQLVQHEQLIAMDRPSDSKKAVEAKRQAAGNLKQLMEEGQAVQRLILKAVRSKVRQYQYKPQSIPFELFQNADDAVVELEEVTGETQTLCVVAWNSRQISLMHWGRPINEFRFGDFDGRDRGYDRDLEKMLVLSYSDKSIEDGTVGVTGKFGLGFKSVFLATNQPRILSGRLGFQVVGGLYPQRIIGGDFEQLQEQIIRESPNQHQRGTLFELPVTDDIRPEEVMQDFKQLVHIMLVFAKRIRHCRIYPGLNKSIEINWQEAPVLDCDNVKIGQLQPVIGQVVGQNKPALVCQTTDGAVLLPLGARGFEPLPEYVPTLWVTAPTQEKLDLGFAINGQFDLDVGRAQLARVSAHNQHLARTIGSDLGTHLCQLFSESQGQWSTFQQTLSLAQDATPHDFWTSLWTLGGERFNHQINNDSTDTILEQGMAEQQSSLVSLLQDLMWGTADSPHGLGRLITEQPALPSQLPGRYQALTMVSQVTYATTGVFESGLRLDNEIRNIFTEVTAWPAFVQKVRPGAIINGSVKRILLKLLPGSFKSENVSLARVIRWELSAADKENRIDPETAQRLGQVITPQFMNELDRKAPLDFEELRGERGPLRETRFKSADGKHHLSRELLLLVDDTDNAEPDEQLRAAFAPDSRVLAGDYKDDALQFFKACRGPMLARVRQELGEWALQASDNNKREAVLNYLLKGGQASQLAEVLTSDRDFRDRFSKSWLAEAHKLRVWYRFSPHDQEMLRLRLQIREPTLPPLPSKPPAELLVEIYEWWHSEKYQYLKRFEEQTYLNSFPQLDPDFEPDDAAGRLPWLSLFMLGSFHTMGRQMPFQHRGFLHLCQDKGWLDTFSESPDPKTNKLNADRWMAILEEYIDPEEGAQQDTQIYHQWMKQFVSIYQLARWLPDYIEIVLSVDRYPNSFSMTQITSPRTNPYLQGGGIAPPQFTRTLGLGANFIVRELARNGILTSPFVYEHCYVPTKQVRDFIGGLGCHLDDQGSVDDSRQVYKFLIKYLGEEKATFDLSFDLPFHYWNVHTYQYGF